MRNRYGMSTAAVLGVLAQGEMSSEGISGATGLKSTNVGALLVRLFRYGLVSREKTRDGVIVVDQDEKVERPRYVFVYRLTEKGAKRLSLIQGKEVPVKPRKRRR